MVLLEKELSRNRKNSKETVLSDYQKALKAEDPNPEDLFSHDYAPTPILKKKEKDLQKIKRLL